MKILGGALATFGGFVLLFLAYQAGTMRYECVSPANYPMGDGTGRWFYLCAGPEPRDSQRVNGFAAARNRLSPPPDMPDRGNTMPGFYAEPTARVSPPQPVTR